MNNKEIEIPINRDADARIEMAAENLVQILNNKGFQVTHSDWRYPNTLRLNFAKDYYGSYGLEDLSDEEFNDIVNQ